MSKSFHSLLLTALALSASIVTLSAQNGDGAKGMHLNDLGYFEAPGTNVLVYSNLYNGSFCDEKLAGIEIIQRGVRIATGGGIRMMNTPEQWDIYADVTGRNVNEKDGTIEVELTYPQYDFVTRLLVSPCGDGCRIEVFSDKPVPEALVGKAGMNLEFFPASYWGRNYLVDGSARILTRYPSHDTEVHDVAEKIPQIYGESTFDDRGRGEFLVAKPMATGHRIVLAPEDDNLRVSVSSDAEVNLFDGRHLAQNGTFVVRSFLPGGVTGKILEWYVEPSSDPDWIRQPNIGFSQVGYTPAQKKVAVVELDRNDVPAGAAKIIRIDAEGHGEVVLKPEVKEWGVFYHRYNYVTIDFTQVSEPGLYCIEYDGIRTNAFPIDKDIYSDKWHNSMDVSLVVNMDHMEVNEAYRIWHGRANMDDALQAPANVTLHDGYHQGDRTNDAYKPLEHIPGLAVGGWYDAGDFDIQANSVQNTTESLNNIWREFRPDRDQTFIDEVTKYADIHRPDGIPDVVQQVMHGTLNMNAQVENIGFVCQVIGQPDMHHYHHLGDALTLTDGLIYDPSLALYEVKDGRSGTPDDRFVFTSRFSPAGTMQTIVSLAGAYPVLKDWFPEEASRSLKNAEMLWDKYSEAADPARMAGEESRWMRRAGDPRLRAAIELYYATGDSKYRDFYQPLIEKAIEEQSIFSFQYVLRVYPELDKKLQKKVEAAVPKLVETVTAAGKDNPYGVAIQGAGWAGNAQVISAALNCYHIWKLFPDKIDPEYVLQGLNYIFGCHPYHNKSFVMGVGVNTKNVAYSNNRADYTFIPGGIVPGLIVKNPDFFENKDDYPFLWGENECCINTAPEFVLLTLAAQEVAEAMNR